MRSRRDRDCGIQRNSASGSLFSFIGVIDGGPGTVDLRAEGHVNGAAVGGNIAHGLGMSGGRTGIINAGAMRGTADEEEIGSRAAVAPSESHARGSECRSWWRAEHD